MKNLLYAQKQNSEIQCAVLSKAVYLRRVFKAEVSVSVALLLSPFPLCDSQPTCGHYPGKQ